MRLRRQGMKTIGYGHSSQGSAFGIENIVHRLGKLRSRLAFLTASAPINVASRAARVVCREITTADLESIVDVLSFGFQRDRGRSYWENAIKRLSEHPTPAGYPKFGYLLEGDGTVVGVLLLIFSSRVTSDLTVVRCTGSSWFVQPAFRAYAALLIKRALRFKEVTHLNLTAARHTFPMLTALGYTRFANGLFVAVAALCRSPKVRIQMATTETCGSGDVQAFETEILLAHAKYGCMSVICEHEGKQYPFVFGLRRRRGVPLAHLIYCRDQEDFVRFAGALGRFLAIRGYPAVVLDANGSIDWLIGRYLAIRPKYAKGPEKMRLGDLAYTERVMFGF
jgi:hypothetical protein